MKVVKKMDNTIPSQLTGFDKLMERTDATPAVNNSTSISDKNEPSVIDVDE
jgi:hypothetical protein